MMRFWGGLSPFTRLLAVVVFLAALGGSYTRLRLQPQASEMKAVDKELRELRTEVREARERVQRLEREAESASRWGQYATQLESQSTGRSLRDVIATCGTDTGPDVSIVDADFQRRARSEGFDRVSIALDVLGEYEEIVRLLDELDHSYPPIAFRKASIQRPESEDVDGEILRAELEGVIHEPR